VKFREQWSDPGRITHATLEANAARLAELKAARERATGQGYQAMSSAQGVLNSAGVRASLDLEDHLREDHGVAPLDPWPLYEEMLVQHEKLHR
jgi:hypothetical protein